MFSSLGWPEIAVLILVALVIFGPDRLPGAMKQAGSALRSARETITGARKQMKDEFGDVMPDFDPSMLSPKAFVRKHLLDDLSLDDEPVKPAVNAMQAATPPPTGVTAPLPAPASESASSDSATSEPATSEPAVSEPTPGAAATAPEPAPTDVYSGNGSAAHSGNGVTTPAAPPPSTNGVSRPMFVPVSAAAIAPIAAGKSPVVITSADPALTPPVALPATPYDEETT